MRLPAAAALLLALAAAPARGDAKGYTVETAGTTSPVAKGATGKLVLAVRAEPGWHIEPRAPLKIDLVAPPGLKLQKTRLDKRKDVVNPGAETPRFEAPFEAVAPGTHELTARIEAWVCEGAKQCVQHRSELPVRIAVK